MATRISEKKEKKAAVAPVASQVPQLATTAGQRLAMEYLGMRIHQFLVSYGEPARLGDIAQGLADDGVTPALVRYTLSQHPSRFIAIDRRWDVRTRFLDKQRPISKLLEEIVGAYDSPIAAWDAAHELGMVIGRSPEGSRTMVERMLKSTGTYAPMVVEAGGQVKYGLKNWLVDLRDEYENDNAILFYNFLPLDALKPFESVKVDWEGDPVAAALKVVGSAPGNPKVIDNRLLMLIAQKSLGEDYVPNELFSGLANSGRLYLLPAHRWTDDAGIATIRRDIGKLSELAAQLPEEEEAPEIEIAAPLSVSDTDLDEMLRLVSKSEVAISSAQLMQDVYDSSPGERTYATDLQIVSSALRAHSDKFQWVGYDRFRVAGSLPPYIGQIPESLQFIPVPAIPNADEDLLDQMIEDEGFERGIERDIRNPIAMDVNDMDSPETYIWPDGNNADSRSIRLVLKSHHKEIGTFPLCQVPPGFFATDPEVVELTLRDTRGIEYQIFVDYDTQLIYGIGLFDLYATIAADSGAIFTLERTPVPGNYRFVNNNETDEDFYIAPERLEQLQNYRQEIEEGPTTSTHDLVRYILEHSNHAMSYLGLLSELNVVRRVTRRQLASILSGWPAFSLKGGLWSYDTKKAGQGFNKAKRKYII